MFYFDPIVQGEIKKCLNWIRGSEHKEGARQAAYEAIADECPLTLEDAVSCVKRAIDRYRFRVRMDAKRYPTVEYDDGIYPANYHDRYAESDPDFLSPSRIDEDLFMNTERPPRHSKSHYRYWLQHA